MLQSFSTPIKMATKDTSLTHGINSLHLVCRLKIMIRLKNHNKLQHSLDLCCCAVFVSFIVCLQVRCGLCVCYMFCVCGYICECLCEFVYLCARMCVFISMRLWVSTYTFLFVCVYNICIFIQKCFQWSVNLPFLTEIHYITISYIIICYAFFYHIRILHLSQFHIHSYQNNIFMFETIKVLKSEKNALTEHRN